MPQEHGREQMSHKPMNKLLRVPVQQQVLLQLALVPVEQLPVEKDREELVEAILITISFS